MIFKTLKRLLVLYLLMYFAVLTFKVSDIVKGKFSGKTGHVSMGKSTESEQRACYIGWWFNSGCLHAGKSKNHRC